MTTPHWPARAWIPADSPEADPEARRRIDAAAAREAREMDGPSLARRIRGLLPWLGAIPGVYGDGLEEDEGPDACDEDSRIQIVPFELTAAIAPSRRPVGTRFIPLLVGTEPGSTVVQLPRRPWAIFRLVGIVTAIVRFVEPSGRSGIADGVDLDEVIQVRAGRGGSNLVIAGRWELYDLSRPTPAPLREYPLVCDPGDVLRAAVSFRDLLGGATLRGNNVAFIAALCDPACPV